MASIVGGRWGRRGYTVWGHRRIWEGSLTMLLVSVVALILTLVLLPGSALSPATEPLHAGTTPLAASVAAAVATLAEAIAPAGTDNVSVPMLNVAALYLLLPV